MTNETIVLDPEEFKQHTPRTPLGLDELGIRIISADWGDAEHELFLVKQERGEIPADRHPPNRTVTIKLKAEASGEFPLAKAAQMIQQKVGRFQEEGGWVKRTLDEDGGYITDVGMIVHTAVLGGLHGWMMAHRGIANEITLTLTTGPYCYGTEEIETSVFVEEVNRQIIYKVPEYLGTAPGLKRVIVKNIGGVNWLGCFAGWESRDFQEGATAEPHYTGGQLTPLGAAAYSGSAIIRSNLAKNWTSFVGSKLKTGEHLTHVGPRRILCQVECSEKIELRLEYRSLGSPYWSSNDPITIPTGAATPLIVDMGSAKPETATLGSQKWEFRIAVNKGESPITFASARLFHVWLFPGEMFVQTSYTPRFITPVEIKNEDTFTTGGTGNLNGQALSDGSGNWAVTGSSGKEDFQKELIGQIHRSQREDSGTKIATPPGGPYKIVAAEVNIYIAGALPGANSVFPNLMFAGMGWGGNAFGPFVERWFQKEIAPGVFINETINDRLLFFGKWYLPLSKYLPIVNTWYNLKMMIVGGNYAVGWMRPASNTAQLGFPDFIAPISTATGTPQIWDQGDFGITFSCSRYYNGFRAWIPDTDAVAFAGRKMEMRSDGIFRQGELDDVWARLIPDCGFLPTAAPSGLEARPTRGIILPTQGNFNGMSDQGNNKIEVVEKYHPGYHFTSEAS